jgi:hypothetical protein
MTVLIYSLFDGKVTAYNRITILMTVSEELLGLADNDENVMRTLLQDKNSQ